MVENGRALSIAPCRCCPGDHGGRQRPSNLAHCRLCPFRPHIIRHGIWRPTMAGRCNANRRNLAHWRMAMGWLDLLPRLGFLPNFRAMHYPTSLASANPTVTIDGDIFQILSRSVRRRLSCVLIHTARVISPSEKIYENIRRLA